MTRAEIIEMMGWHSSADASMSDIVSRIERIVDRAEKREREACAKMCDDRKIITPEWQLDQHYNQGCGHCAAAIRGRR